MKARWRIGAVSRHRSYLALSWSPRGDALLVATTGNHPGDAAVIRYRTR